MVLKLPRLWLLLLYTECQIELIPKFLMHYVIFLNVILSDILVHVPSGKTVEQLLKVVGEEIGIKPGPKPHKRKETSDIPSSILGPKGSVIN